MLKYYTFWNKYLIFFWGYGRIFVMLNSLKLYKMKTIKRTLATVALLVSFMATANNEPNNNVTINQNDGIVSMSVLNKEQATYKVYVYNRQGEIIHKSILGSNISLGQQFDFSNAPMGTYKFKLVSNTGETSSYTVRTGA